MCQRMCPLTVEEAEAVLDARRRTGRARLAAADNAAADEFDPACDAWPGSVVPVFVPAGAGVPGGLAVATPTWGFESPRDGRPVFNTRLDTALAQLRAGRGLWADAIAHGRCLVPVRAFYEGHMTERVKSERTGKPVRRQYRFRLPGAAAFLLAGVMDGGRLSIVTTEPNADVAPVHNRMPLVLGPGESDVWLFGDFASLADRGRVALFSEPER